MYELYDPCTVMFFYRYVCPPSPIFHYMDNIIIKGISTS